MAADHYAALDVEPTASAEELRRAYNARALALHPDRHLHVPPTGAGGPPAGPGDGRGGPGPGTASAAFLALQAAWEVLRDPVSRASYDESTAAAAAAAPVGPANVCDEIAAGDMAHAAEPESGAAMLTWPCRCGECFVLHAAEAPVSAGPGALAGCRGCSLFILVRGVRECTS